MKNRGVKICFFLGAMRLGGIGKTSINLMEYFCGLDYNVDLYLTHYEGEYLSQIPSKVKVIKGEGNYLVRFVKYAKYLLRNKPSVVISARDNLNFLNVISGMIFSPDTRKVVTLRTNQTVENTFLNKRNSIFKHFFLSIAYKHADVIVAVSKGVAADFSTRFSIPLSKINVIYNPVFRINEDVISDETDKDARSILNKPNFKFILGVGRLKKQKDFPTLIKAFKLLSKDFVDLHLIILGEGEERERLEKIIYDLDLEDKVFLPGFVKYPAFFMEKAEVFVLSSLWEGFGNVIVDALGTGCKVVSTNCPSGPDEILNSGVYGNLVAPGSVLELSESIANMLQRNIKKEFLIDRANDFSVETIGNQYLSIIISD